MKAGRKTSGLTPKETVIMQLLWEHGPLLVREMLELYPEPRPHFNTVATTARILEDKGYVEHTTEGGARRYSARTGIENVRRSKLSQLVADFFNNSYRGAVSALVEEEKISVDELKEIIAMVENRKKGSES